MEAAQRIPPDNDTFRCKLRIGVDIFQDKPQCFANGGDIIRDITGEFQSGAFAERLVHRAAEDCDGIPLCIEHFRHCAKRRAFVMSSDSGNQNDKRIGRVRSLPVLVTDFRRLLMKANPACTAQRHEIMIPKRSLDPETGIVLLHLEHSDTQGIHQRILRCIIVSGFDLPAFRVVLRRPVLSIAVILENHRALPEVVDHDITHGNKSHLCHIIRIGTGFRHRIIAVIRVYGTVDSGNRLGIRNDEFDVQNRIEQRPDLVTRIGRGGKRQNQHTTGSDPPPGECMPHVFGSARQTEPRIRRIKDTGNSNRRVGQKTEKLRPSARKLRLEKTTDHTSGECKVIRNHVDSFDSFARQNRTVNITDRAQYPVHDEVVRHKHCPVERFDRVISRQFLRNSGRSPDIARIFIVRVNDRLRGAAGQKHCKKQE